MIYNPLIHKSNYTEVMAEGIMRRKRRRKLGGRKLGLLVLMVMGSQIDAKTKDTN